jgi:hypothetical protein
MSIDMQRVLMAMTAKAAYPGSDMCRKLKISESTTSIFLLSWYCCGSFKYGGSGWPFWIELDSSDNSIVISWLVRSRP